MTLLRTCLAALLGVMLGANALAQNAGSNTMLDTLFAKLQTATDPMAIQSLEGAIWEPVSYTHLTLPTNREV